MSVDKLSSDGRSFSIAALTRFLSDGIDNQQPGQACSSPMGDTLLGGYTREQLIAQLSEQLARAQGTAAVTGKNGLLRMNWFDGRFLTAQALKQQDSYWDQRLRLQAQIFPPGISWGLGLDGLQATLQEYPPDSSGTPFTRNGGTSLKQPFTLHPGVAFDGIGRPIVVGQDFCFSFEDLISRFQSDPRQVTTSGEQFQSCLCLEPLDGGAGTPGSAVVPGPYLLMIEARECPEGDARVYGEACAGDQPARCQSNAWRGGFGLSLVRFPADPPSKLKITSAWDLRGTLSAYYYDVFEHSLITRWDPEFARDDGFCDAVGSDCQQTGAIPLAMVYIGFDGSLLFVDQWIPRRGLAATTAADWTQTRLGAPPQAAAQARVHQFQCMLKQSLSKVPLDGAEKLKLSTFNLYQRGFRHIPPVGFLPFDPSTAPIEPNTNAGNISPAGNPLAQFPSLANTALVEREIDRYFCRTSVIPYYVVALHDDDVLEDINNAFHKDPVRVADIDDSDKRITNLILESCRDRSKPLAAITGVLTRFKKVFTDVIQIMLRDTDLLVNHDIEVVKVIIPLQGLRRQHPLVDITDTDTAASLRDWYSPASDKPDKLLSNLERNRLIQSLREQFGMEALPRHFAVYVKQRMVLLDAVYLLFELINQLLTLAERSRPNEDSGRTAINSVRELSLAQPQARQAAMRAALGTPIVRETIAFSLVLTNPGLASSQMWDSFFEQVDEEDKRLTTEITDPVLRRRQALDRVADAQGEEVQGFEILKLLIAVQDPDAAEASLRNVQRAAKRAPALDERGLPRGMTLKQELLHDGKLRIFSKESSRELWRSVNAGLELQPASKLVTTATTDATAAEVLRLPARQAEKLLGGSDQLAEFRKTVKSRIDPIAREIDALVANPPSADVSASFRKHLVVLDGDPVKALARTQAQFKRDAAAVATLKRIKPMVDLLRKDGFQPVADRLFPEA
jgi:hypothetical protein